MPLLHAQQSVVSTQDTLVMLLLVPILPVVNRLPVLCQISYLFVCFISAVTFEMLARRVKLVIKEMACIQNLYSDGLYSELSMFTLEALWEVPCGA